MIEASRNGEVHVYTSMLTMNECLYVKDDGEKLINIDVKNKFRSIFESGKSGVYSVNSTIFIHERARDLTWEDGLGGLKPMDSIHIATALELNCIELFTGDERHFLRNAKEIKKLGISVIRPSQTKLLPDKYLQMDVFEGTDE